MIGFSVLLWFCAAIMIIFSISLLKGDYSNIHGKVFDHTVNKESYAKALGKPVLLMGFGLLMIGILAAAIQELYSIAVSAIVLLSLLVITGLWFCKIQKRFYI